MFKMRKHSKEGNFPSFFWNVIKICEYVLYEEKNYFEMYIVYELYLHDCLNRFCNDTVNNRYFIIFTGSLYCEK